LLSVVLAALLTSAPKQPVNSRCAQSPLLTGDIITAPGGKTAVIDAIAGVYDGHKLVGWIYDTPSQRLVQAIPPMSKADRRAVGIHMGPNDVRSGLMKFPRKGNPWGMHLKIHYCRPAEMILGKYSRSPF